MSGKLRETKIGAMPGWWAQSRLGAAARLIFAIAGGFAPALRADQVADIVEIHIEAMGGRARIEALQALRASGEVTAAGKAVKFSLLAARPDRVRVETTAGGRTLVQGSDGVGPAWESEIGASASEPKVRQMAEGVARTFTADAEFDDPLVAGEVRGYAFGFGGETAEDGRKLLRIMVTRRLTSTFTLLLDATTYLIVGRQEVRETATGRRVAVMTRYGDFRPVDGVLLPHQVSMAIDGRTIQETRIDRIEANPAVVAAAFAGH